MVISCVAFGCVNRQSSKDESLSFHRFPHKKPVLFRLWKLAVRRNKWEPTKTSYICSKHFKEEDYIMKKGMGTRAKLKSNAVPSVFNFSNGFKHKKKKAFTNRELVNKYPNHVLVSDHHYVKVLQQTKPISSDRELKNDFSNHILSSKAHKIRTLAKTKSASCRELQHHNRNYSLPSEKHQIKSLQAQLSKLTLKYRQLMNINYKQKIVICRLNSQFKYLANELINGDTNCS